MSNDTKNNKGPSCGCGRPDLYEEWLKQSKTTKEEDADSTESCQFGDDKNSDDEESGDNQKKTKTKNRK